MSKLATARSVIAGRYIVSYCDRKVTDLSVTMKYLKSLALDGYRVEVCDIDGRRFVIEHSVEELDYGEDRLRNVHSTGAIRRHLQ